MRFSIILAVDNKNWIWKNGDLAWKLSGDMKYFKNITSSTIDTQKQNVVVMWRKTWDSIPAKFRPLPGRVNCVLSRSYENKDNKYSSLENCLSDLEKNKSIENIFIIGWANLYNQVLDNPMLDKIYLTKVEWDYNCDVFFDWVPDNFKLESESEINTENNVEYRFLVYKKVD